MHFEGSVTCRLSCGGPLNRRILDVALLTLRVTVESDLSRMPRTLAGLLVIMIILEARAAPI